MGMHEMQGMAEDAMRVMKSATEPTREYGYVKSGIDSLMNEINVLEQSLNKHYDYIAPVLRPENSDEKSGSQPTDPGMSAVADMLFSATSRLQYLNGYVRNMTSRIDL